MREIDLLIRIFILVEAGEPEAHDGAGGGHHHVAGRELNTFHGRLVVPVQRTYLHKSKVSNEHFKDRNQGREGTVDGVLYWYPKF